MRIKGIILAAIGILAIAAAVSVIGIGVVSWLWGARPDAGFFPDPIVLSNCVTWAILGWTLQRRSIYESAAVGMLSLLLRALIVSIWCLIKIPDYRIEPFLDLYIVNIYSHWQLSLAYGVVIALAIKWAWALLLEKKRDAH